MTEETSKFGTSDLTCNMDGDSGFVIASLDRWAHEIGDKTCFYYGEDDITLSYAQFSKLTDAIAGNLAAQGIMKGDFVSVFTGNPMVTTLSMFGIWKAGAVYCPINFSFTAGLLSYQLNDTRPKLLITERGMVTRLNDIVDELPALETVVVYDAPPDAHDYIADGVQLEQGLRSICWDDFLAPATRPDISINFDDIANILYTSGTTGPSKGVLQTHRWMNQYTFMCRRMLTQDDIMYNDLPLYHVGGAIFNVVRGIWMGCTVACWDKFSTTDFWPRIRKTGASVASLIDTMIPWLLSAEPTTDDRNHSLNKIHMQPLPKYHEEMARRFGLDYISIGFGQTESGMSFFAIVDETDADTETPAEFHRGLTRDEMRALAQRYHIPFVKPQDASRKGYMGNPTLFVEAVALNEQGAQCSHGEIGQLALRPRLPAMFLVEYLRKPEATVKAFRNLWFHTGDMVRLDPDGTYIFMDRMGDRIRVRGENVSSFELEDIANRFPGVSASAAFPIPAQVGDEHDIVLCLEMPAERAVAEAEVVAWLAEQMPKFMRPRYVRIMASLPRTATQKLEKYKLRAIVLAELAGK